MSLTRVESENSVKLLASTTITIDYLLDSMQDNKIVLLTENLNPSGTILFLASIIQPSSGQSSYWSVSYNTVF